MTSNINVPSRDMNSIIEKYQTNINKHLEILNVFESSDQNLLDCIILVCRSRRKPDAIFKISVYPNIERESKDKKKALEICIGTGNRCVYSCAFCASSASHPKNSGIKHVYSTMSEQITMIQACLLEVAKKSPIKFEAMLDGFLRLEIAYMGMGDFATQKAGSTLLTIRNMRKYLLIPKNTDITVILSTVGGHGMEQIVDFDPPGINIELQISPFLFQSDERRKYVSIERNEKYNLMQTLITAKKWALIYSEKKGKKVKFKINWLLTSVSSVETINNPSLDEIHVLGWYDKELKKDDNIGLSEVAYIKVSGLNSFNGMRSDILSVKMELTFGIEMLIRILKHNSIEMDVAVFQNNSGSAIGGGCGQLVGAKEN